MKSYWKKTLENKILYTEPYGKGVKFTYNKIWGESGCSLYFHAGDFGTVVKLRLGPDERWYKHPIYLNCSFKYQISPAILYYIFYNMMESDEFKFMQYMDSIGKYELDLIKIEMSIAGIEAV